MSPVNMHDAKSQLSKLVDAVERGEVAEVVIARNGRPAAKLVPILAARPKVSRRIGVLKGRFVAPLDTGAMDAEVADLLRGAED